MIPPAVQRPTLTDIRWLLVSLGLVMALHVAHLALWLSMAIALLGLWRYAIAIGKLDFPRLMILLPLTVLGGLGIMLTYHGLFGRDASVALLVIMLSLKLMETNSRRDFMLLTFLSYFLTTTAFLFNQSVVVGLVMLLPIICLTATLVSISHPNGSLGWKHPLRLSGIMLAQAAPVMLALFLLFPRVPGPLWGVPQDSYRGMTGLSDSMEPGNISQLSLSGAIAFRVEFKGEIPKSSQLYWRGPVLWHFDGRSWRMSSNRLNLPRETLRVQGGPTLYSVTLEPHNRNILLMLDMPTSLPSNALLTRDYQVQSRELVRTRIRYDASSNLNYTLAARLDGHERELALQTVGGENPRAQALAEQWVSSGKSPEQIVQTALTMFREQPFSYTLSPPLLGANPIDDFLFNTRSGFCEHYASSFTYLMRAAGIPARVVTGYQGGEVNSVGNYLIVRQSDAHAWSEVWLEGRGWTRVDPTAAVSPLRIEFGIAAALPESNALPILSRQDFPLLRKLYLSWDTVNNGWNQWVLGYDQQRQLDLLSRLAGNRLSWQDLTIGMMLAVGVIGLAIGLAMLRGKQIKTDKLQRLYAKFLSKLESAGIKRASHEGPLDFGQRAAARLPHKAQAISQISGLYADLRYGSKGNAHTLERLRNLIKGFKAS